MSDEPNEVTGEPGDLVALGVEYPIWDRFFQVSPLVVIGTKEPDGSFDLAPKHMAMGWENYFVFHAGGTR